MQHVLSHDHAPLNLSSLQPPGDQARPGGSDEAPFPAPSSRGALILRRWLAWTGRHGRTDEPNPLDDHTLSDIGLTRIEMLYWDPR